jgi:hypothetical protein
VANLNQPDFSDTFTGWLQTVHKYPKAYDFQFESITSTLEINLKSLFAYAVDQTSSNTSGHRLLCNVTDANKCQYGTTIDEFEYIWDRKLNALKFAITLYLRDKDGILANKFFIPKGDTECRFNVLNFIAPHWNEIVSTEGHDYRLTVTLDVTTIVNHTDPALPNELKFQNGDEIFISYKDDYWQARRMANTLSYEAFKRIDEPFRSLNKTYVNVYGLLLEYQETNALLKIADMTMAINEYSLDTSCDFNFRYSSTSLTSQPIFYLNYDLDFDDHRKRRRSAASIHATLSHCQNLLRTINSNIQNVRNFLPFWRAKAGEIFGILDYVDPIQSAIRTWDLPFAVVPCQLKWSNKMMIVLPNDDDDDDGDDNGRCLKFTIATNGEVFVVIATTPSSQLTWYTMHITTKGVIFYRV